MFYIWLAIVIILSIIEAATVNLVSIWFVVSGIITMIVTLLTDNLTIQITTFLLLGIIFMLLTRKTIKKISPEKAKTNLDRIIGMEGIVTEKITKTTPGEVKVDGKKWAAIANNTIDTGTAVKILEINSTKLKVERISE